METVDIDLENNCTYFQPIPKLEDIATLVATLETWNYCYSHYNHVSIYYGDDFYEDKDLPTVKQIVDSLKIPNSISEKIKLLCDRIKKEMNSFQDPRKYYDHNIHNHNIEKGIMSLCDDYKRDDNFSTEFFLRLAVWDTNGRINDKKTAENVLCHSRKPKNGDLVFKIITQFCLVDYIEDFPLNSLSKKFLKTVDDRSYFEHKITDYWIKFKTKNISNNYKNNFEFNYAQESLINSLKSHYSNEDWPVYEHFWDFFTEKDQVKVTLNLIRHRHFRKYQMNLFSKLNCHQLKRLYSKEPIAIIANFLSMGEVDLAKAAWDRVKTTIDGEKFATLLDKILKNAEPTTQLCVQFLNHLWNTASEHLIEYMTNKNNYGFIDKFLNKKDESMESYFMHKKQLSIYDSSCASEFLKAVLFRTPREFKLKFLLEKGPYLILNHSHTFFSSIIEHCLNAADQLEIKEKLLIEVIDSVPAGIMQRFRDLLHSSLEEFNELLTFFTPRTDLQTRFKKSLLGSGLLVTKVLWRANEWAKVAQFIDELYPNQEDALRQKKDVVFPFLRQYCTYEGCYRPNGDEKFSEIDNLLTQVLTPDEIATVKENIINKFREDCTPDSYNGCGSVKRMNIARFTSWCYGGDAEKISRFRASFPMNEVFHALLSQLAERYINGRSSISFSPLDEFLRWRFSKNKIIKTYKMGRMRAIMRSKVTRSHLWKTHTYPRLVKKIISWMFDGDRIEINKFQRRYSDKEKMTIIHWLSFGEESDFCEEYYHHTSNESD